MLDFSDIHEPELFLIILKREPLYLPPKQSLYCPSVLVSLAILHLVQRQKEQENKNWIMSVLHMLPYHQVTAS